MFIEIRTTSGRELIPIANITRVEELAKYATRVVTFDGRTHQCYDLTEQYVAFKSRLADYVRGRYPYNTKDVLKPMNLENRNATITNTNSAIDDVGAGSDNTADKGSGT